eukprot:544613-Pleurochrysis_carterae.AAC.1
MPSSQNAILRAQDVMSIEKSSSGGVAHDEGVGLEHLGLDYKRTNEEGKRQVQSDYGRAAPSHSRQQSLSHNLQGADEAKVKQAI